MYVVAARVHYTFVYRPKGHVSKLFYRKGIHICPYPDSPEQKVTLGRLFALYPCNYSISSHAAPVMYPPAGKVFTYLLGGADLVFRQLRMHVQVPSYFDCLIINLIDPLFYIICHV